MLANVRTVLLHTSHPGNIGASARALKTMGLDGLWLVSPKQFPHAEATARASGADDVLQRATVCDDLDAALEDCRLVIGASARARSIPCPVLDPRECALQACAESATGRVAILYGREQSGLSNAQLDRCHFLVRIPVSSTYGSLNLAAAVQVISYELLVAHRAAEAGQSVVATGLTPVSAGEMEHFYEHLQRTLVELDFLDPANPRQLMRRLRRLYNRARPDNNEINILRGILTAAQQARK